MRDWLVKLFAKSEIREGRKKIVDWVVKLFTKS
jgi:hypothetical protein